MRDRNRRTSDFDVGGDDAAVGTKYRGVSAEMFRRWTLLESKYDLTSLKRALRALTR